MQLLQYCKYLIGQTRGLKKLDVADKKMETRGAVRGWVNADAQRKNMKATYWNLKIALYQNGSTTIGPLLLLTRFHGWFQNYGVNANNFMIQYQTFEPIDKKEAA